MHKLKTEYGLRVLAHTTDIDIGKVAWANIKRAVGKLDVDHVVYRPSMAYYRHRPALERFAPDPSAPQTTDPVANMVHRLSTQGGKPTDNAMVESFNGAC